MSTEMNPHPEGAYTRSDNRIKAAKQRAADDAVDVPEPIFALLFSQNEIDQLAMTLSFLHKKMVRSITPPPNPEVIEISTEMLTRFRVLACVAGALDPFPERPIELRFLAGLDISWDSALEWLRTREAQTKKAPACHV